jgi:hypothetical protein
MPLLAKRLVHGAFGFLESRHSRTMLAMRCDKSPFRCGWWGTEIQGVPARQRDGTYGLYEYGFLPALPFEMRGKFDWLNDSPGHESHIGQERARELGPTLEALRESARTMGVQLPEPFLRFMESRELQAKIRSNTDCFLALCPEVIQSPVETGYLVRFLADSQGCIFWYLFITADGSDHAVVASPGFYGTAEEREEEEEEPDPNDIVFSEESFEAFLCRFWIENEIWFSEYEKKPLSGAGKIYVERYRR